MGVRRAVNMAEQASGALTSGALTSGAFTSGAFTSGAPAFSLGPLVHNPTVLAELEKCGIKTPDKLPADINGCTLIIRAHGISPEIEKDLRNKGARIVDATCPNVKKSQLKVQELASKGYSLFLAGVAEHAEIEGLLGYASRAPFCAAVANSIAAQTAAQTAAAEIYKRDKNSKTALLGQTTISEDEYSRIGKEIKKYFPNLEIIDTICAATADRQQALRELLNKADAVIVAGGKDSANTRCLFSIAQDSGKPCALIEDSGEIPAAFYSYKTIGLCAGASTPDSVIDEIEKKLMIS